MTGRPEAIRAVPVRHPGRWVSVAVIAVLIAMLGHFALTNTQLKWSVVGKYLFDPSIIHGIRITLELTIVAMFLGIFLGVLLAVMRLSKNPIVAGFGWIYVWFFRGTPVLVQLLFWFNLPAIVRALSVGIPFGPSWLQTDPKTIITAFVAATLGLGLNEAAYMAEIARAGLLSVDEGQREAAEALGMSSTQTMRRIVLPQAMRVIVPPTGNETISMLKTTSLVSAIGVAELLYTAQIIYARTYQTIPLLIVASLWYLFMTSILTVGQYYVERYYARGSVRNLPPTPIQKLRKRFGIGAAL
ncbi:MAG: amino acid ABC transporter permease [Actinomycetes bacterium]